MTTNTTTYADEDGNFVLSDGSLGNPGCDECGSADAVVRIDGRYLCSAGGALVACACGHPNRDEAHVTDLETWQTCEGLPSEPAGALQEAPVDDDTTDAPASILRDSRGL